MTGQKSLEWDYVTLAQPEGIDEVRYVENAGETGGTHKSKHTNYLISLCGVTCDTLGKPEEKKSLRQPKGHVH
eukprot:1136337-Pelagomonas_calceolata.AAC.5